MKNDFGDARCLKIWENRFGKTFFWKKILKHHVVGRSDAGSVGCSVGGMVGRSDGRSVGSMVFLTDLVDHQWLTIFKTFSSTEISEISSAVTCKHACYTFWPCHMQTLCWCFAASVLQKWLQCKDRSHQNFSIRFLQPPLTPPHHFSFKDRMAIFYSGERWA